VNCVVDEACNFDRPVRCGKQIAAAGVRGNVVTLEKCTIRLVVTIRVVLVGEVRDVYCTDNDGQSEDEALRTHFDNGWRVVRGLVFCDRVEEQTMRADDRLLEDFGILCARTDSSCSAVVCLTVQRNNGRVSSVPCFREVLGNDAFRDYSCVTPPEITPGSFSKLPFCIQPNL
jgi:hypothetical protein